MFCCICENVFFIRNHCNFWVPRLKWFMSCEEKNDRSPFSRKYYTVMTERKKKGKNRYFWGPFLLSGFLPRLLFPLLSPSLPSLFLALSPSQSPLWCLRLIVLRGVDATRVYRWHWIAEMEHEMTKASFSCLLTSPESTLKAFITFKLLCCEWKGKRKQIKWRDTAWEVGTRRERKSEWN